MTLYKYLCVDCNTLNHIHWFFDKNPLWAPYCCECGQNNYRNYEFKGSIKIEEEEQNGIF